MKKQDIFIILILLGFLGVLINHINKAVQETVEVMQYAAHIMDTPPGIDLSDTAVFYINEPFNESQSDSNINRRFNTK